MSQVRLQPIVQQNVVTYATVIDVPNPELKLKPGMTANVNIEIAKRTNVLRVPNAALRFRPTNEIFAALGQTPPDPADAARIRLRGPRSAPRLSRGGPAVAPGRPRKPAPAGPGAQRRTPQASGRGAPPRSAAASGDARAPTARRVNGGGRRGRRRRLWRAAVAAVPSACRPVAGGARAHARADARARLDPAASRAARPRARP